MATRLTQFRMKELSGVDEGANELPGWIVQKAKDWEGEVAEFEQEIVGLRDQLSSDAADLYFSTAPEEITKARDEVLSHLEDGMEEVPDDAEDAEDRKGLVQKLREKLSGKDGSVEKSETEGQDAPAAAEGEPSSPGEDESGDSEKSPPGDVVPSGTEGAAAAPEGKGTAEEAPAGDVVPSPPSAEDVAKAVVPALTEQLDPIREAISGLADRTEALEKSAAVRKGLNGQEVSVTDDEDGEEISGVAKAIRRTLHGEKVELV